MILWLGAPYNKSPLCQVGGHIHCGSDNIMCLVAEKIDSKCSCFNPPLLFISKGHDLKAHDISNS